MLILPARPRPHMQGVNRTVGSPDSSHPPSEVSLRPPSGTPEKPQAYAGSPARHRSGPSFAERTPRAGQHLEIPRSRDMTPHASQVRIGVAPAWSGSAPPSGRLYLLLPGFGRGSLEWVPPGGGSVRAGDAR
jgi:hypothetical protein